MNTVKFTRWAPGLYTDHTNSWVISREDTRSWYSIRACLGLGTLLDGVTLFPDMGSIWHGDYHSLADAKQAVELMLATNQQPTLDNCDRWTR